MQQNQNPTIILNQEMTHAQFVQQEHNIFHLAYEKEFAFYNAVKSGRISEVRERMLPLRNEQLGRLSEDNLRNLKYHLIITIALITRFCIEGGMVPEDAYTMSDIYIRRLDICRREDEIDTLHETAVMDFTRKMKKIKKESILPKPVVEAMDYVYGHLHEKIRLEDIASAIGLNKTYLCGLFKKETQMTLGEYIMKRRLEAARNMLAYSDYSSIDICNYLCFSSHSHFINAFKKETGMTPKQFRNSSYRTHFSEHL